MWLLTAAALLTAFWSLNYYMPSLAPHWSQKYLFESYYEDCHLHPNPPAIELNWLKDDSAQSYTVAKWNPNSGS